MDVHCKYQITEKTALFTAFSSEVGGGRRITAQALSCVRLVEWTWEGIMRIARGQITEKTTLFNVVLSWPEGRRCVNAQALSCVCLAEWTWEDIMWIAGTDYWENSSIQFTLKLNWSWTICCGSCLLREITPNLILTCLGHQCGSYCIIGGGFVFKVAPKATLRAQIFTSRVSGRGHRMLFTVHD